MFRVDVDSLKDYLDFDLKRRTALRKLDMLIRRSASGLKRYFHSGTPAGEPGMRFKMIGYGNLPSRIPRFERIRSSPSPASLSCLLLLFVPYNFEDRSHEASVFAEGFFIVMGNRCFYGGRGGGCHDF